MKDNLDWVHHDSKTVNENYYQVLEGTRSYGKTYGSINEINVNNIIIERNKAVKELEDYKSRCEKAIEFNQIVLNSDYVYSQDEIASKNLNILNGSDEK